MKYVSETKQTGKNGFSYALADSNGNLNWYQVYLDADENLVVESVLYMSAG